MPNRIFTNVSRRAIHLPGDVMLVPNTPTPVPDDLVKLEGFQRLLDSEDIKEGEQKVKSELGDDEDMPKPRNPPVPPPKPPTKN